MKKILLSSLIFVMVFSPLATIEVQGAALGTQNSPKLANLFFRWDITESEARDLAKWDLLIIDMEVQHYSPNSLKLIRKYNPDIKLLAYLAAQEVRGDSEQLHGTLRKKLIRTIEPEWWLKDTSGQKVAWWPTNPIINVSTSSPTADGKRYYDVFPWFLKNEIMSSGQWDGIFLDNVWEDISFLYDRNLDLNQDGQRESREQMVREWDDGMTTLLSNIRNVLGPDALVVGNGGEGYYSYMNGTLYEHFPDRGWAPTMKKYAFITENGKSPSVGILNSNVNNNGNQYDYRTMRFGYTSALLGNGMYSFDNGDASHRERWWYDEYDAQLGRALGKSQNVYSSNNEFRDGVWRRDYEHGIVIVNATNKIQSIKLNGQFEKLKGGQNPSVNTGAVISDLDLDAYDGAVLLRTTQIATAQRNVSVDTSQFTVKNVAFRNGSFARFYDKHGLVKRSGQFVNQSSFANGSHVLIGNIDKAGGDEVLVADRSQVHIYNSSGKKITSFYPYAPTYDQGINIAIGDLDGNGTMEIITGTKDGGGPHIRVFNHHGTLINPGFFAYAKNFRGGVQIAVADLDGNGTQEVIAGAGVGGGPHVRVFDRNGKLINPGFFAYDPGFRGGVHVSSADIDGDGRAEIVTGPGVGGSPLVRIYNKEGHQVYPEFYAFSRSSRRGVDVLATDVTGDGLADVVATTDDVATIAGF